jgi:hypothetical protein
MKGAKYTYERSGLVWVIYRWKYTEKGGEGTKISEHTTMPEAREKVYRLNGWKKPDV